MNSAIEGAGGFAGLSERRVLVAPMGGGPSTPDLVVAALLADDPVIADGVDLLEVHELLTVSMPGAGPCLVDVTWDPPLVRAGLLGTLDWDGASARFEQLRELHPTSSDHRGER